jgi:hypothetical protein
MKEVATENISEEIDDTILCKSSTTCEKEVQTQTYTQTPKMSKEQVLEMIADGEGNKHFMLLSLLRCGAMDLALLDEPEFCIEKAMLQILNKI